MFEIFPILKSILSESHNCTVYSIFQITIKAASNLNLKQYYLILIFSEEVPSEQLNIPNLTVDSTARQTVTIPHMYIEKEIDEYWKTFFLKMLD